MEHLFEAIARTARERAEAPAMTFVDYRVPSASGRRDGVPTTLTYGELDRRVRALAARLQRHCGPTDRVAVLCPHEPAYVIGFLACLYAGVVGVPLHAPEVVRDRARLRAVISDCRPEGVITTGRAAPSVRQVLADLDRPPRHLLYADDPPAGDQDGAPAGADWRPPELAPEALAYLQYTSGSTGAPAGVRISQRNLSAANRQIRDHFPDSAVTASWVPFFHDFGLVCGLLNPLAAGSHTVHISPMAFVQDPYRWLRTISDYQVDWSITPNFSLAQCVNRVTDEQKRTLDLSSLRLLTVAAEPVRAEAVDAFVAAFADCGLRPTAPTPCYGLAEATLPVTAPPLDEGTVDRHFDRAALAAGRAEPRPDGTPDTVRLVSCGLPRTGVSVRVVDPAAHHRLADGEIGEIWVRGPNVADGYWARPDRTAEVFAGRLRPAAADDTDDGPWLRTGDLGFLLDGRLHVTGRLKDLVIVRGRNHYPDDIEITVQQAVGEPNPGLAAAFAVDLDGTERLIVLLEANRDLLGAEPAARDATRAALRREVTRRHGVDVHDLVLVRRGLLARTSSGKIRRGTCRDQYLRGEFHP
ncbi:fatty acyl-AMP ligase [Solwaraspora sp. WMMD1047]|uniref:fatty acyl-AMP ligase n=1 Tax=Solwaraspora sp. WMMD1047 TaxID=3016102 RepID=UPI002416D329|nr:fatty acyl-AMP ligase [Solwaraspora sp. WMMD1047]MDG4827792.1 fatty acyl-AMP ligase [Solwaraspora sp. WMMD1047]